MGTSVEAVVEGKARLSDDGHIEIPAAIREAMGFAPGETLLMDVEDGVLRVESYQGRIRRIQREFARYIKPGVLASDELIAERREEFRREEEELARDLKAHQERLLKAGQVA
jgi:bifunctional DNA-binding transcriptional regulator/antitoxin component of YhaV-PrlF toxin-antitoxin module